MEAEFFLADRLGMTVSRLRDEMSNAEFVAWCMYHARKAQRQELAMKKAQAKKGR